MFGRTPSDDGIPCRGLNRPSFPVGRVVDHRRRPLRRAHPVVAWLMLDLGKTEDLQHGRHVVPEAARRPFFSPYRPPTGLSDDRAHASTVPSFAGFCSSALPSGIQSPRAFSIECRSSIARR
jgi:hypothetical protein